MAEEEPSENSYSLQNDRRVVFLTKAHDLLPFFLNILRVITPIIVTRISSSVPRIPYFIVGGAAIDHIQISGQYPPPPVPLSSETVDLDIQVNSLVNSITNTTIPLQDDTLDQYIAYFYQVAKLLFDTIQFNYRPENPLFADLDPVDLAIEVAEQSKYGATPIPSIQLLTADNKVSIQGFYMISPKVKYIKLLACVQYRGIHDHILEYYIPESDFFIRESPLVLNGLPYTPLPLLFHQQIITALYRANRLDSKSKESPDYLREFVKIRIHTERILYLLYILDSFLFPDKDSPLNPAFTPLYAKVQASLVSFTALFEDGKEISAPILEVSHKWFTLFPGYYDIFKRFFVPYKNLKVLKDTFFSSARSLSPAAAEFQPPGEASDAVAADAAEPGLAANAAEVPVDDFINLGEGDVGLAGNPVVPLPPPPPPPPSAPVLLVGENAPLAQVPPEKAAPPLPTLTVKQLKKAAKKAAAEESARKAVEEAAARKLEEEAAARKAAEEAAARKAAEEAAARKLEEEAAAKKAAEEVAQEAASKKAAAAAKKVAEKAAAAAKKAAENAALENALRQATLASKGTTKAPAAAATPAATSTPSKKKMSIAEFKAEQAKKQAELKAEEEKKAKEESQKQKLEEYIKKKEIYDANIKSLIPKLSPFDTDFLTDGPIEVEPLKLSTHFINQPDSLAFKPFVISTSVEPFSGIQSKCLATIQYFIHFRIEETKPFLLLHLLPEFTYKYSQPAAFPSMISMYETNYTYFTHRIIIFLFQLFDIMPSILKGGDIANQSKLYTIINDLLNFNNKFSLLATIQEGIRLQVSALFMKLANPAYIDHVFTEIKDPSKKDSLDSIHSDLFNKIFGLTLGLLSLLLHLEVAKYKMYPEDLDAWPFADSKPALETLDDPTSPEFPFSTHNISDFIFRFAETLRSKSLTPSYYVESIIVKQLIREFFHYVRALSLKKRITGRIQSMLREGKLKEAPNVYFYFPKESLDKMTVDPEEKVDSLFKSKLSAVGFDVQNIPFVNGTTFTDDIPNARIQSTIDDCLKNPAADTLVLDMNIERVHEFYQKELEILLTTTKKNNVDGARADMSDNHSFWICSLLRNLCVKQPPLLLNENFHEWKQEDIYTIEVMRGTPPKPVRIPLPTELSQFMLAHLKYLRPENDVLGVMKNVVLKGEDPELLLLKDPSTKYDEALDVHILEVYLKSLYKHAHIATDLAEHIPSYIQTIDYYPNLISYILPYQIKDIVQAPQQPDLTHVIKQLSSALKKKGGSRPGSRSDSRPASRQQRRKTVRRRKASKH